MTGCSKWRRGGGFTWVIQLLEWREVEPVPGVNVIEIEASPRQTAYQDSRARYESLQFRNVRLESESSETP